MHRSFLRSVKAFIFDLDGVLVDSYECWFQLLQDVMREQGKVPVSKDEFHARWGQGPEADREAFFPEWTLDEVMNFYERRFPDYVSFSKSEPGSKDFLKQLRSSQKRIAVASNSPTAVVEDLLRHATLSSFPDVIVGVDQVQEGKPAPDLLLKAIELLKLNGDEVCYVGDSVFDAQAADRGGIFFVGYKRAGDISVKDFQEFASYLV